MSELRDTQLLRDPDRFVEQKIKDFVLNSQESRLAFLNNYMMFDEPLVRFADGDDNIFTEYKEIIGPVHLTPREAMAVSFNKTKEELPARLSVISWILPIIEGTRKSNRIETNGPSRLWSHTRWYGEKLNEKLGEYMVKMLTGEGYMAVTPHWQPCFPL